MYPVIYYDGHCPFCHFWVRILLKYDKKAVFRFAPLTGKSATSYFAKQSRELPQSIVLIMEEKEYLASQAVFGILKILGGPFRMGLLFKILPLCFTDFVYHTIANNRFFFGKAYGRCFLPQPRHKDRFFD